MSTQSTHLRLKIRKNKSHTLALQSFELGREKNNTFFECLEHSSWNLDVIVIFSIIDFFKKALDYIGLLSTFPVLI